MKCVITIPAYNEQRSLAKVLEEIKRVMNGTAYNYSLLVVDDGSADHTASIAREAGAQVISHKRNRGLATTFATEMRACLQQKADIIVHTDADGQYPAVYIPQMIRKIEQGADLVLGSRFGKGRYAGSLMKRLGNVMFANVISGLTKTRITDSTTGFRAFTKEVAAIRLINNFTYTQEQIIKAAKQGFIITELPITTRKTRTSRLFKSPIQYAVKAWINILRIYRDYDPLRFFGTIGMLFFGVGFLLGLWVLYSIATTGGVGGIPRVILSAVFLLTGIQIMVVGFLADMHRIHDED